MRTILIVPIVSSLIWCGCGRISSRAVGAVSRSAEKRAAAVLGRDLERDAANKAVQLQAPRRVFRYVTKGEAEKDLQSGFLAGMHFTSKAAPGRPLTSAHAAERYGLEHIPDERLSVTLPAGTNVKSSKVIGGAAGYGEIRIEQSIPAKATTNILDLKSGK